MMKIYVVLFVMLTAVTAASAQNSLKFKVAGAEDSTLYLIRYAGEKLFYADTAKADKNGLVSFDPSWTAKPGMYMVMTKAQARFEVILNNEDVMMETSIADLIGSMKVKQSKENKLFYEYIHFIGDKRKEREALDKKKGTADAESAKKIEDEIRAIDKSVIDYQKKFTAENASSLVGKVVLMSMEIDVPEPPRDENGVIIDSMFQRNYYISHYWDHYDLKDDAITRMPAYQKRLEALFETILVKHPDSLIDYADRLIARLDPKSEVFKFTVVHLTSKYQQSKIMCMDAVFVHMVLSYYKTGMAFWMNKEKNKEIVDRAEEIAPNICGLNPHNLALMDTTGNWPRLYSLDNKFVVLIFWSPDCGHCKKEMPQVFEKYETWKKDGIDVEVYAVSKTADDEWKEFITEQKWNWINTAVPPKVHEDQEYVNQLVRSGTTDLKSLNYHGTFDVYKTPTMYIIDSERKIVGKNLDAEGLDSLLRKLDSRKG